MQHVDGEGTFRPNLFHHLEYAALVGVTGGMELPHSVKTSTPKHLQLVLSFVKEVEIYYDC